MTGGTEEIARAKGLEALSGISPDGDEPRLRRKWRLVTPRGLARAAIGVAGLLIALTIVAAGVLFSLLAAGPIDLASLKPSLARSLQERIGNNYRVSIGPTFLTRDAGGLGVGFGGIEIRDREGHMVVAAPNGRVGLDVLSLMTMEVKVKRLELSGLELKLRVRPDGKLSVAAASTQDAAPIELAPGPAKTTPGDIASVVAALIEALAGSDQPLDRVSLVNGVLDVENEGVSKSSVYKDLTVNFEKDGDSAAINVSALGPAGRWSVNAKARGGAARTLAMEARDLSLDDLLLLDAGRPPFDSDMPISFKLDAGLTRAGAIQSLKGGFSLGAGYFKLDDPDHEPFLVDEATGHIAWDGEAARYSFDDIELLANASHYRIAGWLAPPKGDKPAWGVHLQSNDTMLEGERPGEEPVTIDDAEFDAHYAPAETKYVLDRFFLHGPQLQAQMSAEATKIGEGMSLNLDLQVGKSALADIMRIWPTFINADARAWCQQNMRAGEVVSGSMKFDWDAKQFDDALHKRAVPADSVRGDFSMRDVAVDLLPGEPALTGLDVTGFLTGRVFSVGAKHGVAEFAQGRRMLASDIYFRVPDTSPAPVVASQAGAHLQGGADALADLLTREAVKKYAGFAVDPASVKGQFQGQLTLDLGIGKTVKPEDQHFRAEGSLANLQLDKFLANEKFEQGALDVTADSTSLKITGQGVVNGLPAKVEMVKSLTDDGSLGLSVTVDDAARAKLGISASPTITGPMAVKVKAPLNKSGADVEIDLVKVAVESPDGGTLKAAGKPGKATFSIKPNADSITINALAIDAGPIMVRGAAQLGLDGALQSAKLTQLRLSAGDDLKMDIQGGPIIKATVRGAMFDARNLVKSLLSHDANTSGAHDLDIDIKVGSVLGANKQAIAPLELTASRRAGALKSLQVKGQIGTGPLSARKDDSGVMTVRAEDAGALGKFLDLYAKMEGGLLELTLRDEADGSHGVGSIKRFVLRNEPALKRMAAAGAPVNGETFSTTPSSRSETFATIPQVTDVVKFDKMTANFTRSSGRLDLREAVIFNPEFGLTTQGFIDYAHDRVDLNGTYVPAYQLNNLVNGIPVVGFLLGGGQHEGIFGVNYRISGPASSPTLNINPLSGLTPGILRKIFGVVDGTTPAPNSYAPQQPEQ